MPWTHGGPFNIRVGDNRVYSVTFDESTAVTSPTAALYNRSGSTVTGTYLSGSASATGNVVTLPSFTSLVAGRYVLALTATVDGSVTVKKMLFVVRVNGDEDECWGEITLTAGDSRLFTFSIDGASLVTAASTKVYLGKVNYTTTNLTGSTTYSTNVVSTPTLSSLVGGRKYVLEITVTADGKTFVIPYLIRVTKATSET